ncbi:uncharacterized protein IL334_005688 [Kwoniella shivajii]|uniref:UDP-glycosyltransferases domain-containing protein n=1 Tax=Kwoniella shivajii TaxID=564305 RepID=A0ABZ1D3U0_9TREE|nr:hypothetical protein IL334_005688 [Kwoniella shivajii]
MTVVKPTHFVVVPLAMWGHLRPLLHLSLNLLAVHPNLHLTLLAAPSVLPKVESELKSTSFAHIYTPSPTTSGTSTPSLGASASASAGASTDAHHTSSKEQQQENKAIADRLQVITCISPEFDLPEQWDPATMAKEGVDYAKTIPAFLKDLLGKEHKIQGINNKFEDIAPDFLIFDVFNFFIPDVMRAVSCESGNRVIPLIGFVPSNATASYHTFAEEEKGGSFAKMLRLVKEDVAKGRDTTEAYGEHSFAAYGQVKKLPGLADKFDWPNMATIPFPPGTFMAVIPSVQLTDDENMTGLICPTTAEIEMEAVEALEKDLGKRVYMVGPQFPESSWIGEHPIPKASNAEDEKVYRFLDDMDEKYGPNSVIYVSFGSIFFPVLRPEIIRYILQSLKQAGFPFLFAHASGMAQIPDELIKELEEYDDCCIVNFAPQWDVVNHDATGFFLTHCGSNSTAEAILAELPLVTMPFAADQGEFAALLTEVYKVGIDLKQVKTFSKPEYNKLYDGTVVLGTEDAIKEELHETWNKLRGPEGEVLRTNMKKLKSTVKQSWVNGRSKKDMLALGRCFE